MQDIVAAWCGGILIGFSALLLMWANGRIAGVSGIAGRALESLWGLKKLDSEMAWHWLFLLGIPLGAWVAVRLEWADGILQLPEAIDGVFTIVLAGLLVGFGTRLGSGCTSGHGVCGLGRLSKRSAVATGIFMSVAAITVLLQRL